MKTRKIKGLLSLVGIIGLTLIINSYMAQNQKEIPFPDVLYGIPTYEESRLSYPMSSLNGDPYIAVFLSNDSYKKILQFYKDKLKIEYKTLEFGLKKRNKMLLTVYQFELERGILPRSINKGVEIIPLNSRSQRVYKAKTKIKIILPKNEILELNKKNEDESNR